MKHIGSLRDIGGQPKGLIIGTSNFFELAVAVAIGLLGLSSGGALATVVGVLVEVAVMRSLVAMANRTKKNFLVSLTTERYSVPADVEDPI